MQILVICFYFELAQKIYNVRKFYLKNFTVLYHVKISWLGLPRIILDFWYVVCTKHDYKPAKNQTLSWNLWSKNAHVVRVLTEGLRSIWKWKVKIENGYHSTRNRKVRNEVMAFVLVRSPNEGFACEVIFDWLAKYFKSPVPIVPSGDVWCLKRY